MEATGNVPVTPRQVHGGKHMHWSCIGPRDKIELMALD